MTFKKFILLGLLLGFPHMSWAGGFDYLKTDGVPIYWENASSSIPVHPESGDCGDYSNAEMLEIIQDALDDWSELAEVDLVFSLEAGEVGDISDSDAAAAYYGITDGTDNEFEPYSAIIFDDDGAVTAATYGCESVGLALGGTTITHVNSNNEISRAASLFSCACFRDNPNITCDGGIDPCSTGLDYNENVLRGLIRHELGHFLNLGHTPLYHDFLSDADLTNDNDVPLMYPLLGNSDRDFQPTQDDKTALGTLYPSDDFESSYCTLTGTLLDQAASSNELQCAAINAINSDASESVSFVTGSTAQGSDINGDRDIGDYDTNTETYESTVDRGKFVFKLKPGKTYQVSLTVIDDALVDASGMNPCKDSTLPECTTDMLTVCNDNDADTLCSPCVTTQDLITSSQYISLYRGQCVGGATIDVGTLTATESISLESSINFNDGVVAGDDDDDDDDAAASGCQLYTAASQDSQPASLWLSLFFGLCIFRFYILRRVS